MGEKKSETSSRCISATAADPPPDPPLSTVVPSRSCERSPGVTPALIGSACVCADIYSSCPVFFCGTGFPPAELVPFDDRQNAGFQVSLCCPHPLLGPL